MHFIVNPSAILMVFHFLQFYFICYILFDLLYILAPRITCSNKTQLISFISEIISYQGEGLILQMAGSHYEPGRSSSLLKLKVFKKHFLKWKR
jgi:hypothetical protein